jgi:lipopolysaccharide export system permease protein
MPDVAGDYGRSNGCLRVESIQERSDLVPLLPQDDISTNKLTMPLGGNVAIIMRVITKSILKEMATIGSLTLLGLVVLVLLQEVVRLTDIITKQGVSLAAIAPSLFLALPALVAFMLPVCALITPAITYSRLATDSEWLALQATGYSLYQLLPPIVGLGILMSGATAFLVMEVGPHTNFLARQQLFEAVSTSLQLRIREHVFQAPVPGVVLYVEHIEKKNGRLRDVLIADSRTPEVTTIFASEAELLPDFPGMRIIVKLHNGSLQRQEGAQNAQQAAFERYSFIIDVGSSWDSRKRMCEMTLREIRQEVEALQVSGGNYLRVLVEWHKRLALPVACLVLGVVGAPLGILNRRTGRLGGFAISAGVLLLYYILVTVGSSLAETGNIPTVLGIWTPIVLVVVSGASLVSQVNGRRPFALTTWLGIKRRRPSC